MVFEFRTIGKFLSTYSQRRDAEVRLFKRRSKKRDRLKSGNGRGREMGEAVREMEIVETFSRRQEGRRVKHKFREKKPRSDSKLWNGLTPLSPPLTTVKYRPAVSSTVFQHAE